VGYLFWAKRKRRREEREAMIATMGLDVPKEEVPEMPISPDFGIDSPDGRQELGTDPVYEIDSTTEVGNASASPEPRHLSGMSELYSGFLGHELGGGTVSGQRKSMP
jgi:hypothetical protein